MNTTYLTRLASLIAYLRANYNETDFKPFKSSEILKLAGVGAAVMVVLKTDKFITIESGKMKLEPKFRLLKDTVLKQLVNKYARTYMANKAKSTVKVNPIPVVEDINSNIKDLESAISKLQDRKAEKLANEVYEVIKKYL